MTLGGGVGEDEMSCAEGVLGFGMFAWEVLWEKLVNA